MRKPLVIVVTITVSMVVQAGVVLLLLRIVSRSRGKIAKKVQDVPQSEQNFFISRNYHSFCSHSLPASYTFCFINVALIDARFLQVRVKS